MKIPGFFHRLNLGIFYPGIFQESKSRDFLVPGFFDPGISRDIPGPGYPVDIPNLKPLLIANRHWQAKFLPIFVTKYFHYISTYLTTSQKNSEDF